MRRILSLLLIFILIAFPSVALALTATTTLTGTTNANNTKQITGVSTKFTTEVRVGDQIVLSSDAEDAWSTVLKVNSDTSMEVNRNIGDGTSQTINLRQAYFAFTDRDNGQAIIAAPWGIQFLPNQNADGPDFGPDIAGIGYRIPCESMEKNFLIFRAGQYLFENDGCGWQLCITPTGVCVRAPASNTLVPQSDLEVHGNFMVGEDWVRVYSAPSNGIAVQGRAGFGTYSPISKLQAVGDCDLSLPAISGTNAFGVIARLQGMGTGGSLDIGNAGSGLSWIQSTNSSNLGICYPILLNPRGGGVSIGGTVDPGSGNLYVANEVSAGSFVDRTKAYRGDALMELAKIGSKDGLIDHGTLPRFMLAKFYAGTKDGDAVEYDGRDLGATSSMLITAVVQLDAKCFWLKLWLVCLTIIVIMLITITVYLIATVDRLKSKSLLGESR